MLKYLTILVLFMVAFSCTEKNTEYPKSIKHGGTLKVDHILAFKYYVIKKIKPYLLEETAYALIYKSVFQGLTKFNPNTNQIEPFLATKWETEDGKQFTFTLKQNIFFYNDPIPFSAKDVKNCFDSICGAQGFNYGLTRLQGIIKGVTEYQNAIKNGKKTANGVEGVKIINDSTIQFELVKSFMPFPQLLSNIEFAMYRVNKKNRAIGTGAFVIDTVLNDNLILLRNNQYWEKDEDGFTLPYLDSVIIVSNKDNRVNIESKLNQFAQNKLHIIHSIKTEDISTVMDVLRKKNKIEFNYESIDYSKINSLVFNTIKPPFNDVNLRKAFKCAFNANLFVDSVMNGEGWPANYGLVPPSFSPYPKKIEGQKFNLKKAQEYLKEAGYPNGKGLPPIQFLVVTKEGKIQKESSFDAFKMICNNLNINYVVKEYKTYREMFVDHNKGRYMISSLGYTSKYPSPESYLSIFYLKSDTNSKQQTDNIMFFRDRIFDELYTQALAEEKRESRLAEFYKAEQRMFDLSPLIPLYYSEYNRIISTNIEGLSKINSIGIEDYTSVYFKNKK